MFRAFAVATATAGIIAGASCGGKKNNTTLGSDDKAPAHGDRALVQHNDQEPGLHLRLSDGQTGPHQPERVTPARADKLAEAEAEALLSRMPRPAARADDKPDKKARALRQRSRPAPRTGKTASEPFPPPDSAAAPQTGPDTGTGIDSLEVIRRAPEGDVPLAPHLSITFSQPMVAVTSHAGAASQVPVRLTPRPDGTWRWLGTRTLLFDPEPRFPQATEYTVTIPAGTQSATGAALEQAVSWTFATPPPRVRQTWPSSEPQPRNAAMFATFDQAVDPAAVLATIEVRAGGKTYPVRQLSGDEIAASPQLDRLVEALPDGAQSDRYVAFRPEELLPTDAQVHVDIGPGTPSREGPLTTQSAQSFSFRTYAPLRVEDARCSWGARCPPMAPWYIQFNNPLDTELFDPETIQVSPELPGLRVHANHDRIYIRGRARGRTTYTVTLPPGLTDEFGQSLGRQKSVDIAVGSADPRFWGPRGLVVVDPAARRPTLDVFTLNHDELHVRLYAVTPGDWDAFAAYMRDPYAGNRGLKTPPGTEVVDTTVAVRGEPDTLVETAVDLAPALRDGLGHAIAVVTPSPLPSSRRPPAVIAWIQSTRIGLDAFADSTELVAWATELEDGTPMPGVDLTIQPSGTTAATDEHGVARLPLTGGDTDARHILVATRGRDTAILPENVHWWRDDGGWVKRDAGESLRWYVVDDRAMYRPGEEVHLKGWIRRIDHREGGGLEPLRGAATQISYTVYGPRGNELTKGAARVNALGGFDTRFTLPETPNLGQARVQLDATGPGAVKGRQHIHRFQIQEFRRPEFEVDVAASQGPHMVGQSAEVTAQASYYAGGGLAGADVRWQVTASPTAFTPPNRDDFVFGTWTPWWGLPRHGHHPSGPVTRLQHQARTDAAGKHTLNIDFVSVKPPQPMQVTAQATVMDVNRQAWSADAQMLVHPADVYVGLKSPTYFVDRGEPIDLQVIVVDQDGKAAADRVARVRAARLDWTHEQGKYVTVERDEQICEQPSGLQVHTCSFETEEGGQYRITAEVTDAKGRPNRTEMTLWVSGGEQPPAREVELERVTLVPDKREYQPGDTAEILVQSPFYPAEALMSVRRSGIVSTERFRLKGPTTKLRVPIVEGHIPNVHVQVDVVGAAVRVDSQGRPAADLPRRPAVATGQIDLPVPPLRRALGVDLKPRDRELAPGGETTLDVSVRDASGDPVAGAELAVIVVDEAVLSLSNYQLEDPLNVFYARRDEGARDHYLQPHVQLARADQDRLGPAGDREPMEEADRSLERAPGGAPPPPAPARAKRGRVLVESKAMSMGGGGQAPIAVRSDFDALAVFAPEVRTDAQGRATVAVEVPDNLTRYRVMAVAVARDTYFGKAESSLVARLPLMVRPSPPRFLNFGDTFELPVVIQNQTAEAMTVRVAVRAANAAITGGRGREMTVPARDRVEVRFPAAAELAGTARFQVVAAAGKRTDASEFALPVWTPATTEAFATYGEIDRGAIRQPVAVPGAVIEDFGGLEVTTSSTQLQALTDAFLYLVDYPFACAEQVSSRVLAVAALRDVLTAFQAEGMPQPGELESAMTADIQKLAAMQNHDGGFGFWRQGNPSSPYASVHAAHALARARAKGFDVPTAMVDRAKTYLRNIERYIPGYYPPKVKNTIIAYALSVRSAMGDADPERARTLITRAGLDHLSLEAAGWLLGVLSGEPGAEREVARLRRHLNNRASETAATAHFTTRYDDGAHLILHSSRRADAVILEALIADQPQSDLIPKIARGLLAHRTRGRWQNTQENAFVLLALDRYFQVYENVTPSFVARVWLGDAFAGEQRFRGRSTGSRRIDIPMDQLADLGQGDLVVQKQGRGRLYYRIGMTYAPESLKLAPADHGFAVERRYEAIDDPGDVTRRADGTWTIKAGARVRVRVHMVTPDRRYHVALVDPLPAGLEPLNPALAVTGAIPQDPDQRQRAYWWWERTWYEHQNMRDDRVEAFASLLWQGVHEYTYVARATTPGRFVVPPARAEEMYFPETFGRTGTDVVIVE